MVSKYAALMALIGSVAAQGYSNSSSIASTTSSASGAAYTNGAEPTVGGTTFLIQTDTTYSDATVLTLSRKRQASSGIASCLATCSDSDRCVGTSYSDDTMQCTYYSSIDSTSSTPSPGTDFALVQDRATSSTTSDVFNGTTPVTSGSPSTRTSGVSVSGANNSTTRATGSSTRSAGVSGVNNSTTRATGSASRTSSTVSRTSGSVPTSVPSSLLTINGVLFLIEIDINYRGITIDFAILSKRAGETLDQCLTTCAANAACAGTGFEDGTCTFYSSIEDGSRVVDTGNTFATVISRAGAIGSGNNGTAPGVNGTTPAPASNVTAESLICPQFNGQVVTSSVDVTFAVSCSQFLIGTTFDITPELLSKRQAVDTGLPQTISNCIDLCSLSESCVGTTFNIARSECTYYSNVDYSTELAGFDSATRVQDNSDGNGEGSVTTTTVVAPGVTSTVVVGAATTATVYTTVVSTVTVYAGSDSTAFPSGAVVTTIFPVGTTTYINAVPTITLPQQQNNAVPTVTVTVGSGAAVETSVVTVTVDSNGNVLGSSTAGAVAGGAAGAAGAAYPTVTVFAACTTPAAQPETVWTTVFVR
ncbi:hypothetical protein D6C83_03757 [Aureobasidium pullulans]|uniref:Apple domain-containing protein n=1 Tax=Aureobasidium pullulans TaxID=5580 RepID=A0A4T0D9C1_AURPU|nr:hypothetical protein D6C83_03757 [Aureobasidium pullulans]